MRIRNWGLVAIAAIALSGAASAQDHYVVPSTPAYQMSLPAVQPVNYKHTGHFATTTRGFVMQSTGNYWWSNCPNGQNCNNGAGSFTADLGFAFGPTKSFFAPCGPRVLPDCSGKSCHKCRTPVYGMGPSGTWSTCAYDSFLNH